MTYIVLDAEPQKVNRLTSEQIPAQIVVESGRATSHALWLSQQAQYDLSKARRKLRKLKNSAIAAWAIRWRLRPLNGASFLLD